MGRLKQHQTSGVSTSKDFRWKNQNPVTSDDGLSNTQESKAMVIPCHLAVQCKPRPGRVLDVISISCQAVPQKEHLTHNRADGNPMV